MTSSIACIAQWNLHHTTFQKTMLSLFEQKKLVDLTLLCSTNSVKVHKIVVASSSPILEQLLLQKDCGSHLFFRNTKFEVLKALVQFMYTGQVLMACEDVDSVLAASKKFKISGLCEMKREDLVLCCNSGKDDATFPAESMPPHMVKQIMDAVSKVDLCKKHESVLDGRKVRRTANFEERALSDTEYAILKEAEESRRALEQLQRYAKIKEDPSAPPAKRPKPSDLETHSATEDDIAVSNLTKELNEGREGADCEWSEDLHPTDGLVSRGPAQYLLGSGEPSYAQPAEDGMTKLKSYAQDQWQAEGGLESARGAPDVEECDDAPECPASLPQPPGPEVPWSPSEEPQYVLTYDQSKNEYHLELVAAESDEDYPLA